MIDGFVVVYPNIESLCLHSKIKRDDRLIRSDQDCLNAIQFSRLTTLILSNFNFMDGSFLPKVNSNIANS